jgi:D-glycero-D-manno-heptose 1,7-bisphosphate phosphatase
MFIILDRDGVINKEGSGYIKTPQEWRPIPGSLEKIAQWSQKGYRMAIATNQSGIGRGLMTERALENVHRFFEERLALLGGKIEGIFYCPHHPEEGCICRKPKPGLLIQIAQRFKIDLKKAYFIGDSLIDLQAAQSVNCSSILVKTGKGEKTLSGLKEMGMKLPPVFASLADVQFDRSQEVC